MLLAIWRMPVYFASSPVAKPFGNDAMKFVLTMLCFCVTLEPLQGAENNTQLTAAMMTVPERTDYERTSSLAEVSAVLTALQQNTSLMHREILLITEDGKEVPLLVLAKPAISSPAQAQASGKPIIYIQGNIHGGEVEGKEATLIIMRDILFGDKQHLLDNQILLFVPVYNADGNDKLSLGSRPSQELSPAMAGERFAHGYDLNRDGMAIDTAETAALYRNIMQRWDPDLLVDLHTTNGTWHGYSLTYAPSYHTAGDPATSAYTADVMLPAIARSVKQKFNLDFGWYGSFDYRDWPPTEFRTYHHAPRYLTNTMGLRNRMAILSETFAHDRFSKRVHAANAFVEEILEYTHEHGQEIRRINREADRRVTSRAAEEGGSYQQGVQFEMVPRNERIDLLSYKYLPYTADNGEKAFARSSEIVVIEGVLNFNQFAATRLATVPKAYVFPAEFSQVAEKLAEHGIGVASLATGTIFEGEVFQVTAITKQNFEQNHHRNSILRGQYRSGSKEFRAGDYYVALDNRLANLIFYLMEAESDDGLAYWNFFDAYLEQQLANAAVVEFPVFKVLR